MVMTQTLCSNNYLFLTEMKKSDPKQIVLQYPIWNRFQEKSREQYMYVHT